MPEADSPERRVPTGRKRGPRRSVRFGGDDTGITDETRFHLERLVEDLIAAGATPEEARREAKRRFGDRKRIEGELGVIDRRRRRRARVRAAAWTLADAIRGAARTLRRERGMSALIVGCLALGTGAPAAIFLLVEGLLLQPLPGIERQSALWKVEIGGSASFPLYQDLRDAQVFESAAAFSDTLLSVRRGDSVERALALTVTGSYFPLLGTEPSAGRLLGPGDDRQGAPPVVVVSSALADRVFGGAEAAVGETLRVNGAPFEVAGIAPPGFVGTFVGFQFDLWVPFEWVGVTEPGSDPTRRDVDLVEVTARLPEGASRERAQAELERLALLLRGEHPREHEDLSLELLPTTGIDPELYGPAFSVLALLLGASLVLTLLACAPVANLLFARAIRRRSELAMRRALGAGRAQVATLLLAETLVLALLGAVLGVLAGALAARAVWALEPPLPVALAIDLRPGWRALVFGGCLGGALGLVLGLLQAGRSPRSLAAVLGDSTRSGGGRGRRRRGTLVAAQVALSALLLVIAGLFVRSMARTSGMDPGFAVDELKVLPAVDLAVSPELLDPVRVVPELIDRLEALPGVEAASAISRLPLELFGSPRAQVRIEGRQGGLEPPGSRPTARPRGGDSFSPEVDFAVVAPGFLDVARVPLLRGRPIAETDGEQSQPVAVVSRETAERFWPEVDPLGRRFALGDGPWLTVIGIADDVMVRRFAEAPRPLVYLPLAQRPTSRMTIVLRGPATPAALAGPVRGMFRDIAADLPAPQPLAARSYLAISLLPQRLIAWVAGTLGVVGLLLAAAGVYGVTSYAVSMRRQEMAVRTSLGAAPRDLHRLVLHEGLRVAALGLGLGLAAGIVVAVLLRALLIGVVPADPVTFLTIASGLLAVALLATLAPARRAARADPIEDLRS
ncbi:MAG TPA: ADOP family duplicated permease [Thermoanaerobaculia bacterium]|nr:ADOP family duplicated permease [Thermoanaerobaculia bacterium]